MANGEVELGFEWLYSVLSADSTLTGYAPGGIYRDIAPSSVTTPFVLLAHQSGQDSVAFQAVRPYASLLYQVKAGGLAGTTAQLVSAANRIDTLIVTATQVAVTGGTILGCYRFQALQMMELDPTHMSWQFIGGLYRMMVSSS